MRLPILLLVCAAPLTLAQTSLFVSSDPYSCFTMEGQPSSTLQVVSVEGMSFNRALRVRTNAVSDTANAWDIRPRCFSTRPAAKGDTALATFWVRALAGPGGRAFTSFVVEKGASPWTKSVTFTVAADGTWKRVEVPFVMAESYTSTNGRTAEGYNFSFWVTYANQEIEIGGLSVVNYGQNVSFDSLNLTAWPYAGRAADAPWRKAARDRIERIRKTDILVVARDEAGRPAPGAPVRVRMKRHAFGWGTAIAHDPILASGTDGQRYREMVPRLFNKVVTENVLKWPFFEAGWGRAGADAIFNWLPSTGITDVRGHVLVWPGLSNLPADVQDMLKANPVDKDKLRARIDSHIREIMAYARGKLTEWDVVNEPYTNNDIQKVLGDTILAHWFRVAREADPDVKLYINDYDITEGGGYSFQHINNYDRTIQMLVDEGAPFDGIGLQSHFNASLTEPDRVYEILDQFARFGKDLQVTEFDINIADFKVQADYWRDYMTICFSHPSMKGFMIWGFWAGAHWFPDGAMLARDWTPRPMYDVWNDLLYREWWTDVSGVTGPDGVFRTRGFLGEYDVEVTVNGATQKRVILATDPNRPYYVHSGSVPPGTLSAEGVVNAASFVGGSIAPGEAVTLFAGQAGPAELRTTSYDVFNVLPSFAGDTRVLFDGQPAPLIYAAAGQISAIVPYSVGSTAKVEVEYLGVRSNAVEVPVTASMPGIYCYSGGRGQAVAVNAAAAGYSFNGLQSPAVKGDYLTFFLTGAGAVSPHIADGAAPSGGVYPQPLAGIVVTMGGVESRCSGNWAGLINPAVVQVNACVPAQAPSGAAVPLRVSVGGTDSQPGVTFAVQ